MYYRFNAVRTIETNKGPKNMKITLFSAYDPDLVKNVLRENGILVMSVEPIEAVLGNLYEFWIKSKEGKIIPIVLSIDGKIRDAFKKFIDELWIVNNLDYVKPVGKDLSEDKLKIILEKLKKEFGLIQHKTDDIHSNKKISPKNKEKLGKIYNSLQESVKTFIEEMEKLIPYAQNQFPVESKKLEDLIWQLKKYRVSTNVYKLAEIYSQALDLGSKLEEDYIDFLKQHEKNNFTVKLISEFDIIKAWKKYQAIKNWQIIEQVDSKEFKVPWYQTIFYQLLNKWAPRLSLLLEEQKRKFHTKWIRYFDLMDFFINLFLFVILNYTFLLFFIKLNIIEFNQVNIFFSFVIVSYFWFLFALGKLIWYKNKFLGVLLIIIGILCWKFVKLYFWF